MPSQLQMMHRHAMKKETATSSLSDALSSLPPPSRHHPEPSPPSCTALLRSTGKPAEKMKKSDIATAGAATELVFVFARVKMCSCPYHGIYSIFLTLAFTLPLAPCFSTMDSNATPPRRRASYAVVVCMSSRLEAMRVHVLYLPTFLYRTPILLHAMWMPANKMKHNGIVTNNVTGMLDVFTPYHLAIPTRAVRGADSATSRYLWLTSPSLAHTSRGSACHSKSASPTAR
jgi:hypothetical protein